MTHQDIDFVILPYIGAGPITFGMEMHQLRELFGEADLVSTTELGERDEQRGPMNVRYAAPNGGVVEMSFVPGANLLFRERELFADNNTIGFLLQHDPNAYEYVGFVIFLELGIAITGFQDGDEAQKAVTVFERGRWDEYRNGFLAFNQKAQSAKSRT